VIGLRPGVIATAILGLLLLFAPHQSLARPAEEVLLRIAGDDISGVSIVPSIAKRFLEEQGASSVRSVAAPPGWTMKLRGNRLDGSPVAVLIRATNSSDGFRLLRNGQADIGLSARPISSDEVRNLSALGNMAGIHASFLLARAAIVPVINHGNPLQTITIDQLRGVYAGRITDWAQLGGQSGPIHVLSREPGSASRMLFDAVVMGRDRYRRDVRTFRTYVQLQAALRTDTLAIGFSPCCQVPDAKRIRLMVGRHELAPPNNYALESGDYPIALGIRLYFSPVPAKHASEISNFVKEARSVTTQTDMIFNDFFSVAPQLLVPEFGNGVPPAYRLLARSGLRVSTTIHFRAGSTALDADNTESLYELASYLRFLHVSADKVQIVAGSDDNRSTAQNDAIARLLGDVVVAKLQQLRVNPSHVVSLGATLPLASDYTSVGRMLNRRVETWITP